MAKEFLIERHLGCTRPLATLTLGARASRLGLVQRVDGGLSCSRLPRVHHRPRVRWSSARGHLIAKKELGVSCPPGLGSQVPDKQPPTQAARQQEKIDGMQLALLPGGR